MFLQVRGGAARQSSADGRQNSARRPAVDHNYTSTDHGLVPVVADTRLSQRRHAVFHVLETNAALKVLRIGPLVA